MTRDNVSDPAPPNQRTGVVHRRDSDGTDHATPAELRHELAGLLDGSLRHVSLALDRLQKDGGHHSIDHLQAVHEALEQMAQLVRRAQASGHAIEHPHHAGQTLGQAAACAARLVHPAAQRHGITLTLELTQRAVHLPVGPLRRVLDNALRNSIEAIAGDDTTRADSPHITVTADCDADTFTLQVTDTGPGLPAEMRDARGRFRFGETTKAEHTGTGLAMAQRLARDMGGELTLCDRSPHGTVLTLRCPSAALHRAEPAEPSA